MCFLIFRIRGSKDQKGEKQLLIYIDILHQNPLRHQPSLLAWFFARRFCWPCGVFVWDASQKFNESSGSAEVLHWPKEQIRNPCMERLLLWWWALMSLVRASFSNHPRNPYLKCRINKDDKMWYILGIYTPLFLMCPTQVTPFRLRTVAGGWRWSEAKRHRVQRWAGQVGGWISAWYSQYFTHSEAIFPTQTGVTNRIWC